MREKRFTIVRRDGTTEHILVDFGDEDEESAGYVFLVDSKGGIVGLFAKEIVRSWSEDLGVGPAGAATSQTPVTLTTASRRATLVRMRPRPSPPKMPEHHSTSTPTLKALLPSTC
jgi:hypothetical protein